MGAAVRRRARAGLVAAALVVAAHAREAAAGVLTGRWADRAGACALALEEYDGATLHLRIRPPEGDRLARCTPTFGELAAGLGRLIAAAASDGPATLFLGAVGDVPGLAAELVAGARASAGWDVARGAPRAGDPNGFVAGLLRASPLLRDLVPGCEIVGVSVEKVLVPTPRAIRERRPGDGVPDARLPYDAQLWVRLRRGRPGGRAVGAPP